MEQIQLGLLYGNVFFIGQTSCGVFGCKTSNVKGRLHRLLDGRLRKVRRAGIATAMTHIDSDAQRLVAIALNRLQFTLAHTDTETATFRSFCTSIGGADLFGMFQGRINQSLEIVSAVAETVICLCVQCLGGCLGFFRHGGRILQNGQFIKILSDGYDTCRLVQRLQRSHVP